MDKLELLNSGSDIFQELLNNNTEKIVGIYNAIMNPQFTSGELGISARQINYWEKKNLLKKKSKIGGWRSFSFVDYVWFQIIKKLRDLHVGLELIKMVKKDIYATSEELVRDAIERWKEPGTKELLKNQYGDQLFQSEIIKKLDELIDIEMKGVTRYHDLLTFITLGLVLAQKPVWLVIDKKGFSGFFAFGKVHKEKIINEVLKDLKHDQIIINLYEILENFLSSDNVDTSKYYDLELLSEKEMRIIKAIRERKYVKIIIRMKNGEIDLIETKNERKVQEIEKRINHLFRDGGYGEIRVVLEKGRPIIFEETKRMRL